jgi:hypothetical protein|nr:MAG TPA: hypothetical protein [Caudoviricetes sp.]
MWVDRIHKDIVYIGNITLYPLYVYLNDIAKEYRITKRDYQLVGYDNLHDVFVNLLGNYLESLIDSKKDGYVELYEAMKNIGYPDAALDYIEKYLASHWNDFIHYYKIRIRHPDKLYFYLEEEESVYPLMQVMYLNTQREIHCPR